MAYRLRAPTERGSRYRSVRPRLLVALLAAGAAAGCAHTPPAPTGTTVASSSPSFEAARAHYRDNDYAGALKLLQPLAHKGDERAQYTLGYMYFYAEGVPQDRGRAMNWICRSALQGYSPARAALSELANRPPPASESAAPSPASAPAPQTNDPKARPSTPTPSASGRERKAPAASAHTPEQRPHPQLRKSARRAPRAVSRPRPHARIGGSRWLARRNPHHYTIQIAAVAGNSLRNARWIARRSGLSDTAVVAIHRGQVRWNVVLWGDYHDLRAAHTAVNTLPPQLRTQRPWIRRFGHLQALR